MRLGGCSNPPKYAELFLRLLSNAQPKVHLGGAGRARTDDDGIMSSGL